MAAKKAEGKGRTASKTPAAKPASVRERDAVRVVRETEREEIGGDGNLTSIEPRGVGRSANLRGQYVYCVIQASEALKFGAVGLGAEPAEVHTVHYKDIAAVV